MGMACKYERSSKTNESQLLPSGTGKPCSADDDHVSSHLAIICSVGDIIQHDRTQGFRDCLLQKPKVHLYQILEVVIDSEILAAKIADLGWKFGVEDQRFRDEFSGFLNGAYEDGAGLRYGNGNLCIIDTRESQGLEIN